jgi:hypothetical protein
MTLQDHRPDILLARIGFPDYKDIANTVFLGLKVMLPGKIKQVCPYLSFVLG